MIRTRSKPGSDEFTARLLERLRADTAEALSLESVHAHSRNTVLYRVRRGATPLVCKAEVGSRPTLVEDEHRMLLELQGRLAGSGVRSLVPLAVYPELRVLVTQEEAGETVRRHIERGLGAPEGAAARRFAERLMDDCAEALHRFHGAFGVRRDERGIEQVYSYLDFDPRNVLVTAAKGEARLVLMDPPREEVRRPVHFDLGAFCFGMARAGFTPSGLAQLSQHWIDRLKADFVGAYFRRLGRPVGVRDLAGIRAVERHRAGRALLRYGQFFRYRNWPRELARLAYFSPIIGAYVALHLPTSYRRLARAHRPLPVALEAGKRASR